MLWARFSGMVLDRFSSGVVLPSWSGKEIVVWLKGNEGRLGFDKDGDDIMWCFCNSECCCCCWGGSGTDDWSMLPFLCRDSLDDAVDALRRNEAENGWDFYPAIQDHFCLTWNVGRWRTRDKWLPSRDAWPRGCKLIMISNQEFKYTLWFLVSTRSVFVIWMWKNTLKSMLATRMKHDLVYYLQVQILLPVKKCSSLFFLLHWQIDPTYP